MAVHLPSDLVADVMRNADPARRNAALVKLNAPGGVASEAFAAMVDQSATVASVGEFPFSARLSSSPGASGYGRHEQGAYRDFEHMVLRSLFETLLPEESSGSFGSGPSAGVWRSMAADQLSGVVATHGGIGIADMLGTEGGSRGPHRTVTWPYFSLGPINNPRG